MTMNCHVVVAAWDPVSRKFKNLNQNFDIQNFENKWSSDMVDSSLPPKFCNGWLEVYEKSSFT